MEKNIQKVLITEEQIQARIQEMANEISAEYAGKDPIFVGVLKGVVMFFGDFVKRINEPCQIDFMCISSYEGTLSTGKMAVKKDISSRVGMLLFLRIFLIQEIPWSLPIIICLAKNPHP